jgi:hypothetical protein
MFNHFDAVDPVERLIAHEVLELTEAELKIWGAISACCVVYRRWIAVYPYDLTRMKGQKMADRSRPASGIEHPVVLPRHCDSFYQPEFCFVPKALSRAVRLQSSSLIVSTNVDRIAFSSF